MLGNIKDRYKYEEMSLVIRPTQKSNTTTTTTAASTKSSDWENIEKMIN